MGAGIAAAAVFGGGVLYLAAGRPAKTALGKNSFALWGSLLFLLGLTVRLVLGYSQTGYQIDMDTFKSWARIVNEVGFSQIYRQDIFLDYPPATCTSSGRWSGCGWPWGWTPPPRPSPS